MIRRTPQEIADFFGCYIAQDKDGDWYIYEKAPALELFDAMWKDGGRSAKTPHEAFMAVPDDHDWTHLYEPHPAYANACETHEERMENARITHDTPHPDNKPDHSSEVFIHKEYVVAEGNRIQDLSKKVNTLLSHGWKLQGGVAIEHFPESDGYAEGSAVFYQAMVRGV